MQETAKQLAKPRETAPFERHHQSAASRLKEKRKRFLAHGFLIWDAATREVRCSVPADRDGAMPVARLAGMLAMYCLALKRRLEDFEVLVVPRSGSPSDVFERARQLISVGHSIKVRETLSALDMAILDGVVQNLCNKEIAAKLNISAHTVKAHVSSLLAKFRVSSRAKLGRQFWCPSFR